MVMGGGQQVMVNGSQVASPMRVVSAQTAGDSSGGQTISMNGQSAMVSAQQGQGMVLANQSPSNGQQKVVQIIMPTQATAQRAVIGKCVGGNYFGVPQLRNDDVMRKCVRRQAVTWLCEDLT